MNMLTSYHLVGGLLAAVLILAWLTISELDYQDQVKQDELYCEMTEMWRTTQGEAGWPPYQGDCDD